MLFSIVELRKKRKAEEVAGETFSRPKKPKFHREEKGKKVAGTRKVEKGKPKYCE